MDIGCPTVLVASTPTVRNLLLDAVQPIFQPLYCSTLAAAARCLMEADVAIVVCTLQFDESRLFDLLRTMKSRPDLAGRPFVPVKVIEGVLPDDVVVRLFKAAQLYGAEKGIYLSKWRKELGDAAAIARFRETLYARYTGKTNYPVDGGGASNPGPTP